MKRCKNCKQLFEVLHFNQKYCFKEECKQVWMAEAWKKEKSKRKKELETLPELLNKAQVKFNEYIRLRDEINENSICISCRKVIENNKDKNAGHFFSAGHHWNVRFDELNVHLQCVHCNQHLGSNPHEFRKQIKKKIGDDQLVLLEQRANLTRKFTKEELRDIYDLYHEKIKSLKNDLKQK